MLARMRRARELTGAMLAAQVGMSQPKISRIERGQGAADPEDVAVIARALGATESEAQALKERAERAHNRVTDWRPTATNLAGRQGTLAGWELAATEIRDFQPALITGLLQSDRYARAALSGFQRSPQPQNRDAALHSAVLARLGRQQALADGGKTFHFVFTESVLRNRICSPIDMLGQIEKLREVGEQPNVRIAIIPDDAEVELPALHGFVLYDDDLVVIDLFNTGLTTRGRTDVAEYREVFDAFARHATADVAEMLDRYHGYYLDQIQRPGGR
ncbi:helix-turn-helix domain-containing protein [Paractinoplanes deccanensis]|uniref:helix-turn-helix domain-containing protein n=1 Tax=Paractinoplanes deccanensis TaxID=113561 RepID=UPI0019444636|nr:helix-turn-helix transcriptional regulator [Actinoplanes deccanensis]